ncbi:malectin domain-containing carbohydrate-binding protein [Haladaptatus sp. NG-WS-4]
MSGTSSAGSGGFVQGVLIGGGIVFFVAGMVVLGGIPSGIIGPATGGVDNGTTVSTATTESVQTSTSATQSKESTSESDDEKSDSSTTSNSDQTTKSTTSQSRETVLYRVNVGGPKLPMPNGPAWSRDTEANPSQFGNARTSGSHANGTDDPITMTDAVPAGTPEEVFQTRRYDADNEGTPIDDTEMEYRFPVESGTYEVRVYLAETYFDDSGWNDYEENGPRTFGIEVEGDRVLDDYDMYAELGHDRGTVKSYTVTVDDGIVNVRFLHEEEDPMVSGVEIVRVDGSGQQNDKRHQLPNGKSVEKKGLRDDEERGKSEEKKKRGKEKNDERDDSLGDEVFSSDPTLASVTDSVRETLVSPFV